MRLLASITLVAAIGLTACSTAPASKPSMAQASPATVMNGKLVGPNQMTLYVFDRDMAGSGKSVCNGGCATNWPPLMAPAGAAPIGNWSVITRDDGSKQWAYQGKPLYTYASDKKVGDQLGDNFKEVWHVVK